MKKLLLLTSALLVFGASIASAQINISWGACTGSGVLATVNKNYACDGSSVGTPFKGVFSFVSPATLTHFVGIQAVMDVQTDQATLPDFWRGGVGECRAGSLGFPGTFIGVGVGAACLNPWDSQTGGGSDWTSGTTRARIKFAFADANERSINSGSQYISGVFSLDPYGDTDIGDGHVCAGCSNPACLVVNELSIYQTVGSPGGDIITLTTPATRQHITWQGGAVGGAGCPAATPTQNRTWGSVKALYR